MELSCLHVTQITLTYLHGTAVDASFMGTMQQIGFARALPALKIVSQPPLACGGIPPQTGFTRDH